MSLREGLRSAGAKTFVDPGRHRHARQPAELGAGGPRSQHPVLVPREHRRHHLRGRDLGRLPGPGHRPDGLAGRPLPPCADHRLGHVRLRPDGVRHRAGDEHLPVLPGPLRRRDLPVQQQQRQRFAAGRHLPDQPARADLCGHGDRRRRGDRTQPAPGRLDRHRPWAGRTGGGGPSTSWPSPIFFVAFLAFRLPEPPRGQFEKKDVLGRGHRRSPAGCAVPGGGVRADPAHPHDQDMSSSPSRPSGSACSPFRCSATSTSSSTSVSTPSSAG